MIFAGAAAPFLLLIQRHRCEPLVATICVTVCRVAQLPVVVELALKDVRSGLMRHSELLVVMVGKLLRQLDRLQIFDFIWQKRANLAVVKVVIECSVLLPRSSVLPRTALPLLGSCSDSLFSRAADTQTAPLLHLLFLGDHEAMLANCLLVMISMLSVIVVFVHILEQLALAWGRTGQESYLVELAQIR